MKKTTKIILFILFAIILSFLFVNFTNSVKADSLADQINAQNQAFAGDSGAGFGETTSLRGIIIKIIEIFLGLTATISVAMFVYAGFLYFTSQGEEAKVESAKKTIFYAVIGSAIILMAYSISWFVSYIFLSSNPAESGGGIFDFESNVWVNKSDYNTDPFGESTIPEDNNIFSN